MIYGPRETEQAAKIGEAMKFRGVTISTAESCTGGGLSACFVSVPGSSSWFKGSAVAYQNEIKTGLLGVSEKILSEKGAVSKECAAAMAEGARRIFDTDLAVSITGIAGPDGGSAEKPVGTVWIGFSSAKAPTQAVCLKFSSISRDSARRRFSIAALILCRLYAQGRDVVTVAGSWKYI